MCEGNSSDIGFVGDQLGSALENGKEKAHLENRANLKRKRDSFCRLKPFSNWRYRDLLDILISSHEVH